MRSPRSPRRQRPATPRHDRRQGFTLLEITVTVALLLMITAIGYPAFNQAMRQVRTQAVIDDASATLYRARTEAVRRGVPVVVQPQPDQGRIFAWANVDGDTNMGYDPDVSKTSRTVDYEVVRLPLDRLAKVWFGSPGSGGNATTATDGLTALPSGRNGIVFEPDGSVRDVGAIRFADEWGNFFELRVAPAATARISQLKYSADPPGNDPAGYYPRATHPGTGKPYWTWNTQDTGN